MKITPHKLNEKLRGAYYELDSGKKIYLAHRTPGKIIRPKMAWAIEESVLRKCQTEGIKFVGVVLRQSGRIVFYATKLDDFYKHPKSFQYLGDSVARALPAQCFLIVPGSSVEAIESITRIGR